MHACTQHMWFGVKYVLLACSTKTDVHCVGLFSSHLLWAPACTLRKWAHQLGLHGSARFGFFYSTNPPFAVLAFLIFIARKGGTAASPRRLSSSQSLCFREIIALDPYDRYSVRTIPVRVTSLRSEPTI